MTALALPELTWLCGACLKESKDGYCDCCGRPLTREHLAAYQLAQEEGEREQHPESHS